MLLSPSRNVVVPARSGQLLDQTRPYHHSQTPGDGPSHSALQATRLLQTKRTATAMNNGSVRRAPFHVECMPAEIAWMHTGDCSVFWEQLMDVE